MSNFARVHRQDLTDRNFVQFWELARQAGRERSFTYCLPPMDEDGFCRWMRSAGVEPWMIFYKDEPRGLFFLTDREGKSAQVHFCTLPMGTERVETPVGTLSAVIAMGLYALGATLWARNISGGSIYDTLIGVTPVCNASAIKYIHALGAQDCGVVPGACFYHDTNENVPGLYTVYTRDAVPAWTATL